MEKTLVLEQSAVESLQIAKFLIEIASPFWQRILWEGRKQKEPMCASLRGVRVLLAVIH